MNANAFGLLRLICLCLISHRWSGLYRYKIVEDECDDGEERNVDSGVGWCSRLFRWGTRLLNGFHNMEKRLSFSFDWGMLCLILGLNFDVFVVCRTRTDWIPRIIPDEKAVNSQQHSL